MDEVYRGHRIAIRLVDGCHVARITEASGRILPVVARVDEAAGEQVCLGMARDALSKYLAYIRGER